MARDSSKENAASQAVRQAVPTEVQQATCNLQQATGHINANALHAAAFSCSLLWGNFSFDSIFIFYYAPVAVAEHSLLQLQPPLLQQTVLSISISIAAASLWVFPSPSASSSPSPSASSLVFVIPILRYDKLCLHFNF